METSACEQNEYAAQSEQVAASLLSWLFEVAERRHGVERAQLLEIAARDEARLSDPNALLPAEALIDTFRVLRARP